MASTSDLVDILTEYINDNYEDLHATTGSENIMHRYDATDVIFIYRYYRGAVGSKLECDLKLPVCTLVCEDTTLKVVEGTWKTGPGTEFDLHDPSSIPGIIKVVLERQRYLP